MSEQTHKPGCDALGGYGHGVDPYSCGAPCPTPPAATPAAPGEGVRKALERLVHDVRDLADNSHGVIGLHKNGDDAPWSELTEGGRFDDWLGLALEQADAALSHSAPAPASEAVANLRHVYQNLVNGGVQDTTSATRIAIGLLGPAIEQIERAIPTGDSADAPVQQAGGAFAGLTDGQRNVLAVALMRFEEGPAHELDKQRAASMRAALKGEQPEPSGTERGEVK